MTALTKMPDRPVAVDRELVRRTVAQGATDDELELYLYDCRRRNIHPLDKLLHFTKRKGRYVPITSIDLMRSRAADTGQLAGSDDATFEQGAVGKTPLAATVTVYRLTQGQRFAYTATARWSEYYPGDGDPGFMWRKMPHVMLAKCAEALALRKAFPQELAGLYSREEMDQAVADATPPRVNPHVTRAEDIVDVPTLDDPDRIPQGDPDIKPLPKKNARPIFEALQNELRKLPTVEAFQVWKHEARERVQVLPPDWQDIMRGLAHERLAELRQNEQGAVGTSDVSDDVPEDLQQFLQWTDALLAAVTDAGMLEKVWDFKVDPHMEKFTPPEQGDVLNVFRKHEQRLAT